MNENTKPLGGTLSMSIVFKAGSLNYDEGIGNVQDLKKIAGPDGRPYVLVSRYALTYSILECGRRMFNWLIANDPSDKEKRLYILERQGKQKEKAVINLSLNGLLSGKFLKTPEFDLFGFLVTLGEGKEKGKGKEKGGFSFARTAPVFVSHAISLTPYQLDKHFCGNLSLARRYQQTVEGELSPNLFILEEFMGYYKYNVVVDLEKVGVHDVFIPKTWKLLKDNSEQKNQIPEEVKKLIKDGKEKEDLDLGDGVKVRKERDDENIAWLRYFLDEEKRKKRVEELLKVITNLKRRIKRTEHDLSPKFIVVHYSPKGMHKTFFDKIEIAPYWTEIEEIEEHEEGGKTIRKYTKKVMNGVKLKDIKELKNSEEVKSLEELCEKIMQAMEKGEEKMIYYTEMEIEGE